MAMKKLLSSIGLLLATAMPCFAGAAASVVVTNQFDAALLLRPPTISLGVGTFITVPGPTHGLTNVTIIGQGWNSTILNAVSNTLPECFFVSSNVTLSDLTFTNSSWASPQGLFSIFNHADNVHFNRLRLFGSATDIAHSYSSGFTRVYWDSCLIYSTSAFLDNNSVSFNTNYYTDCTFVGLGTHPDATFTNTAAIIVNSGPSNVVVINGGQIDFSAPALHYTNTAGLVPVAIANFQDGSLEMNDVSMIGTNQGFDLITSLSGNANDTQRIVSRNSLRYAASVNLFNVAGKVDVEFWNWPLESLRTGQAYSLTNQFIVPAGWQYYNLDVSNVITWTGTNWSPGVTMGTVNTNKLYFYASSFLDLNGSYHWNPNSSPKQYTNDNVNMHSAIVPVGTTLAASNTFGGEAFYASASGIFTNAWPTFILGQPFVWFDGTYTITPGTGPFISSNNGYGTNTILISAVATNNNVAATVPFTIDTGITAPTANLFQVSTQSFAGGLVFVDANGVFHAKAGVSLDPVGSGTSPLNVNGVAFFTNNVTVQGSTTATNFASPTNTTLPTITAFGGSSAWIVTNWSGVSCSPQDFVVAFVPVATMSNTNLFKVTLPVAYTDHMVVHWSFASIGTNTVGSATFEPSTYEDVSQRTRSVFVMVTTGTTANYTAGRTNCYQFTVSGK